MCVSACDLCAGRRHYKLEEMDETDQENGLEEEEMILSTEYLVLGHFERKSGDKKGRDAMVWLPLSVLEDSPVTDTAIDEKLDEFELLSVRLRNEVRQRARQAAE